MENTKPNQSQQLQPNTDATEKIKNTTFRGFTSIDQEMEREIAIQFYRPSKKQSFSQKSFLQNKL
jgi:hypothetical protein